MSGVASISGTISQSVREFVSQITVHQDKLRWTMITPTPTVSAHTYLRGGECSVRTGLVNIPLSSPPHRSEQNRTKLSITEEENGQTEIEVGVRRGKGQKSERKKETVVA